MNPGDETETTTATYDEIAGAYAARWARGETLAGARSRFVASLAPGARVLDVGCGPGHDAACLRALGLRAYGVDRSRGMLREARRRQVPIVQGDMRQLPVADARLDGLWVSASLLHIPKRDVPGVLAEFRRVLPPGGVLYLGVKAGQGEGWFEAAQYERGGARQRFFAFYTEAELDELLERAGFAVTDGWLDEAPSQRWIARLCRRE